MASITRLVNSFDVNSEEFESFVHDLMVDNNDVPFDSHEVDAVRNFFIKSVNSRINQGGCDFLPILERILPTCSRDTFSKYGLFWIVNTTKVLENVHTSTKNLTLACKVLGVLIEHCKEIPELHKQISMQHVKQLINVLSALQPDAKCGAVYYLVAVLLYHYPEVCEKFQGLIKRMILLQIDSRQENLVNASARCYVLLSKATERSFKPPPSKSVYTATMFNEALLCNSLHAIMDELFSGLIELESVDVWDQLELPPISNRDVKQYYDGQKQRFANLCIYLSSMLRGYDARNSVLPHDILGVLCRGLAITPLNLKNKTSFKEQMLYIVLPKLHISLLAVLDALINGFAQELVPYGTIILQLFQQTLQWTSVSSEDQMTFSDNNKPFRNVRICTYKCLCSWLINTSSLSGVETIANECVTCILKDITPERSCVLLTVQPKTHLSKRAIKRFKHSQYENSTVLNNGESSSKSSSKTAHLDADLCKEALIALQNIILSGNVLLKQTFYKNVQNTVIPLLYNLYLDSAEQKFYKDHNVCRLELFRVLRALQMNPHVASSFPVQYSLEISHRAAHDIDLNIVREAKLVSAELEKIIHPIAPTLQLPRQQEPDNELVLENQVEEIATICRSDQRSRVEKVFKDADAIPHKRQKIVETQDVIVRYGYDGELIEENMNGMNINWSQTDGKSDEEIEEEIEVVEIEDVIQEQDKIQNKEQRQLDIDIIPNVNAESKMECELAAPLNTEKQKQHEKSEDFVLCTEKEDKRVENNPKISEKITKLQDDPDVWESFDDDVIESLSLFHDEVKSNY
ncbi:proline-, glutamic acid- and leucine-rich protein 1-like [Temnothorax curvispinosus]|uniref:Proline-, glutamic acid- and leucine-rich protein 1-like n=1 Tax=Temnothorax curvispinosus TaxID=300111 RepID=A0A6J1QWN7_9HYME|nr:proline-, glutamic acid- and leucine-rich protein 1-like [Temnothorax curvispinosus]